MKKVNLNGVNVYDCAAGKTTPQWFDEAQKKKESLRYNEEFRKRIELIQDFAMPVASTKIKMSRDGRFVCAAGTYRPRIRVYELEQLSMKFERYIDADVVDFEMLGDDFTKIALLRADRTIELHASYGCHHKTRVPRWGRDLAYDPHSCDLLVAAASNEVYRLNLHQGRFMAPLVTEFESSFDKKDNSSGGGGASVVTLSTSHPQLMMVGADTQPLVEAWDLRQRTRISSLNIAEAVSEMDTSLSVKLNNAGVSALQFCEDDGLTFGVGTGTGHVLLFDLRSSRPFLVKDQRYGLPIKDIKFHSINEPLVVSSDAKSIKIWSRDSVGKPFCSVQPQADVNDVCIVPGSGLLFAAGEQHRIMSYYIPQMGPAPKWCSFLDNLTEELEEQKETSLYDDYKFVTREELESWGLEQLIGTNVLRAYMHGFFMDMRLYRRIKEVTQPFAYENYVKEKVDQKLAASTSDRLRVDTKLPSVNKQYVQQLLEKSSDKKTKVVASKIMTDSRFTKMFEDKDFEIDPNNEQYKLLHPAANNQKSTKAVQISSVKAASDDEAEEEPVDDENTDE